MDSVDTDADDEQYEKKKKAFKEGKKEDSGSYGTAKAKANSSGIRRAAVRLSGSDSMLIIISQTRDNIGFGAQFDPKTVSGGKALLFYSTLAYWLSVKENLKTSLIRKKQRSAGILSRIKFKKNRITGQKHTVDMPILWDYGIDDIGSMIDWLIEESFWVKTKSTIDASDLQLKGTREALIRQIEDNGLEKDLQTIVANGWREIIEACRGNRKKRYS
jgi:hypothetical protein